MDPLPPDVAATLIIQTLLVYRLGDLEDSTILSQVRRRPFRPVASHLLMRQWPSLAWNSAIAPTEPIRFMVTAIHSRTPMPAHGTQNNTDHLSIARLWIITAITGWSLHDHGNIIGGYGARPGKIALKLEILKDILN